MRETTPRPAALSKSKTHQSRSHYNENVQAKPSDTGHTLKHNIKNQYAINYGKHTKINNRKQQTYAFKNYILKR